MLLLLLSSTSVVGTFANQAQIGDWSIIEQQHAISHGVKLPGAAESGANSVKQGEAVTGKAEA